MNQYRKVKKKNIEYWKVDWKLKGVRGIFSCIDMLAGINTIITS